MEAEHLTRLKGLLTSWLKALPFGKEQRREEDFFKMGTFCSNSLEYVFIREITPRPRKNTDGLHCQTSSGAWFNKLVNMYCTSVWTLSLIMLREATTYIKGQTVSMNALVNWKTSVRFTLKCSICVPTCMEEWTWYKLYAQMHRRINGQCFGAVIKWLVRPNPRCSSFS